MKHIIAIILTVLAWPALAGVTPGTACGEAGTGYAASSRGKIEVTRTAEEAAEASVRVGADGYWWKCQMPTEKAPPRGCPMSGGQLFSWYDPDTGLRCVANSITRGPLEHGAQVSAMSTRDGRIGYIRKVCDRGVLVTKSSACLARK